MPEVTITLRLSWQDEDPDGRACSICGDGCYLSMHRIIAETVRTNKPIVVTDIFACGSCHEALSDEVFEEENP